MPRLFVDRNARPQLQALEDGVLAKLIRALARRTREDQSMLHAARRELRRRKKERRNG